MVTTQAAKRIFRSGITEIQDAYPSMGALEAWSLIRGNYPHLKNCVLSEPAIEGDKVIITLEMPPVKTNG